VSALFTRDLERGECADSQADAPELCSCSVRLHEADAAYARAIQLEPTAQSHIGRGLVQMALGDMESAIRSCDRSLEIDPTLAKRGTTADSLIRLRSTERCSDRFLARRRDRRAVRPRRTTREAWFSSQWSEWTKPPRIFARVATRSVARCSARNCAVASYGRGEIGLALMDLDAAIKIDRRQPVFYANRGRILLDQGESERAASDFEQAMALGDASVWSLLSEARERNGRAAELRRNKSAPTAAGPDARQLPSRETVAGPLNGIRRRTHEPWAFSNSSKPRRRAFVRDARSRGLSFRIARLLESSAAEICPQHPSRILGSRELFERAALHAAARRGGNLELSFPHRGCARDVRRKARLRARSDVPDPFRRVWVTSSKVRRRGVILSCQDGDVAVLCPREHRALSDEGDVWKLSYRGFSSTVEYTLRLDDPVRLPRGYIVNLTRGRRPRLDRSRTRALLRLYPGEDSARAGGPRIRLRRFDLRDPRPQRRRRTRGLRVVVRVRLLRANRVRVPRGRRTVRDDVCRSMGAS